MAQYFVQLDGGNGSYFDADGDDKAKAVAALALDSYRGSHGKPKAEARLLLMREDGKANPLGCIRGDLKFVANV